MHVLVMAHVLGAFGVRATFLVLGLAAHAVLAKSLYAAPADPHAVGAQAGAVLMYDGRGVVDVALMVVPCAQ